MQSNKRRIILGGGCFWCLEAVFKRVEGIVEVTAGYAGGSDNSPSYDKVCQGQGGHAEVVELYYDSTIISLDKLLSLFFSIHDPTTLNRQGNDVGIQYRSYIGYESHDELRIIKQQILEQQPNFSDKIITEYQENMPFFPAEIEHKDYYDRNSSQPYCQIVIKPKLDKLIQWKKG